MNLYVLDEDARYVHLPPSHFLTSLPDTSSMPKPGAMEARLHAYLCIHPTPLFALCEGAIWTKCEGGVQHIFFDGINHEIPQLVLPHL